MIRGLYTAATSMKVQMNKMDVISNNMSNANTVGFKKDTVVQTAFSDELTKRIAKEGNKKIGVMSNGVGTSNIRTSFKQGSSRSTEGKLDIEIEGEGFLAISCESNNTTIERYTRDGSLTMDSEGFLITTSGNYVLADNGAKINVAGDDIAIMTDGMIYVDGSERAKLKIVNFENLNYMKKFGDGMFEALEGAEEKAFTGKINQGFLESSNVNVVKEMVEMISLSRNYEANQKVIQAQDSLLDKAVNQVGKL